MAFAQRYLTAVLLLLSAAGVGVTADAQDAAPGRPIDVRFTVFADGLFKGMNSTPGPREVPVGLRFMSTKRSRVYEYHGPNPMVFSAEMRLPSDSASPGVPRTDRVAVARAFVPPGVREALLLFSIEPGWEKQPVPRYIVQVVDDSRATIRLDHMAFLNATGLPLFGTVGDREVQVPTGISRPLRVAAGETPTLLQVLHEGQVLPVYGDLIALERNQRVVVVLFPPIGPEATQVRRRLLYDPDHLPSIPRPSEGPAG